MLSYLCVERPILLAAPSENLAARTVERPAPKVTVLRESDAYRAEAEDGYGGEKLVSERMCQHFREDHGLETRVARYHNVYGTNGT